MYARPSVALSQANDPIQTTLIFSDPLPRLLQWAGPCQTFSPIFPLGMVSQAYVSSAGVIHSLPILYILLLLPSLFLPRCQRTNLQLLCGKRLHLADLDLGWLI